MTTQKLKPDYIRIYKDILDKKDPNLKEKCKYFLNKADLSTLEILALNKLIFGDADIEAGTNNQRFRSYKESDILQILTYQKENNLNNTQLANYFKISKNTITKWKRLFI